MAITATPVVNHPTYKSWLLKGDGSTTTTTFAHGFASMPDDVHVNPVVSEDTTIPSGWYQSVDATNITLTNDGIGSGTTIVAKVCAWLPHSIN